MSLVPDIDWSEPMQRERTKRKLAFDPAPLLVALVALALLGGLLWYMQNQLNNTATKLDELEQRIAGLGLPTATDSPSGAVSETATAGERYLGRLDKIEASGGVFNVTFFPGQLLTGSTAVSVAAQNGDALTGEYYVLGKRGRTSTLPSAAGTVVRMRTKAGWNETSLIDFAPVLEEDHEQLARRYMWLTVHDDYIVRIEDAGLKPLSKGNSSETGTSR